MVTYSQNRRGLIVAFIAMLALCGGAAQAQAQGRTTTLYTFPGYQTGWFPRGGLGMDSSGNLYGTTYYGGMFDGDVCSNCGTIYKLTPPGAGQTTWNYQLLHTFTPAPIQGYTEDGIDPISPLVNFNNVFYGTTNGGGDTQCGCGTVFSITPNGTYTILHVFDPFDPGQASDQWPLGTTPVGGLLIGSDGTIYGTTDAGGDGNPGSDGSQGAGIIYKMNTSGGGFQKIHDFDGSQNGGPQGMMIFGQDGAIYGTQYGGGKYNQGLIFRITTDGSTYQDIYDFLGTNQPGNSTDGADPEGRLALGPDGTIYGTTTFGGSPSGYGTAWSIKLVNGVWTYKQLYIFGYGSAGSLPHSGLIMGTDGNLYGTTAGGGEYGGGVVYRLVPSSGGQWTYQTLYNFYPYSATGDTPYGDLLYAGGKFYGVNVSGGDVNDCNNAPGGCGNVFEYSPGAAAHDFNGDGTSDILWRSTGNELAMWLMSGGLLSSGANVAAVPSAWSVVGSRDFNGDGDADILWKDTSGDLAVWLMHGASMSSGISLGNVGTQWTVAGTGDFNGDGVGDILWRNSSTGAVAIWLMSNGQLSSGITLGTVPLTWQVVGTGDFNGDGTTDILWRNTSTGDLSVWLIGNGQFSSGADLGVVPTTWTVVGTGDFNGDGTSDILWRQSSGTLAIWLISNAAFSSGASLGTVPTTWSVVETGDFNGDGDADILWKDTSGDLAVWLMNGLSVSGRNSLGNVGTTWTVQGQNAD